MDIYGYEQLRRIFMGPNTYIFKGPITQSLDSAAVCSERLSAVERKTLL